MVGVRKLYLFCSIKGYNITICIMYCTESREGREEETVFAARLGQAGVDGTSSGLMAFTEG